MDARLASYRAQVTRKKIFRTIICVTLCFLSLMPFYITIVNATRDSISITKGLTLIPSSYFMANFQALMKKTQGLGTPFQNAILNSFMVAAPATLLQVYFASMTAYGINTYTYKMKGIAWSFILAIMMIPTQVSIIGFYKMMIAVRLNDTYVPLIIPVIAAPVTVFFMRQYMRTALSLEIVEAARIDGSNEFRTFNTIVIPLMKPAIATQAIFCFVASWNTLYTPSIILSSASKYTLPMFIQLLRSEQFRTDYGMVYMGIFITVVPILLVYFCLSKYIVEGVALGGVKE